MTKQFGRRLAAASLAVTAALGLSACGPQFWPGGGTPTPSGGLPPSPSTFEETLPQPAITVSQFERVLEDTRQVFGAAIENKDAELLSQRAEGSVLQAYKTNFQAAELDDEVTPLGGIPDGEIELLLPEQNESWPRRVLAIVGWQDGNQVSQALVFSQDDARSDFKLVYKLYLQPDQQLPEVAASQVGSGIVSPDSQLSLIPPKELPALYGEYFAEGDKAERADLFTGGRDDLYEQLGADHKRKSYLENKDFELVDFTFSTRPGSSPTLSFATRDGGVLVFASFQESIQYKPKETEVDVQVQERSSGLRALLGGETAYKNGVERVDEYQVVMYLPPASGDSQKITMVGSNANLLAAREL